MRAHPVRLLIGLAVACLALMAHSRTARAESIVIMIGPEPISGQVMGHDENGFEFKLDDTGDTITLRWEDVAPLQARQIRKHLGIDKKKEAELTDEPVGDIIDGVKVVLKTKQELVGIEVADRSNAKALCISLKKIKEFMILRDQIEKIEKVRVRESLVRTLDEMYRAKLASKRPDSAQEHYDLAEYCREIGHVERSKEHYEKCQILDPRYAERITEKLAVLAELAKKQKARKLDVEIARDVGARDFAGALKKIDLLNSGFPDSEYTTKWLAQIPGIEEKRKDSLRRKVITSWYQNIDDVLRNFVYKGISDMPDTPVKIVRVKGGTLYKGRLQSEGADEVVLKDGNTTYRIARDQVVSMTSATLGRQAKRPATFAEAKAFATDEEGGITREVALKVAEIYDITEQESKDLWQARLKKEYVITRTGVDHNTRYYSLRQATYGKGSWLRDGAVPVTPPQGGSTRGGRGGRNQQSTVSSDPEAWWKMQPLDTRVAVLRAICYEAIMEVTRVFETSCSNCGGKGYVKTTTTAGETIFDLCPRCHGVRIDYKVMVK